MRTKSPLELYPPEDAPGLDAGTIQTLMNKKDMIDTPASGFAGRVMIFSEY